MHSFEELSKIFTSQFTSRHFPLQPEALYDPAQYFLSLGGKRVRPVVCLMANELFGDIAGDAYYVANAIELFHNFTLIHDDIMDKAPLRRNHATVHTKYGESTALLAGDVMLVVAYEYLNKINATFLRKIIHLFNTTAKQVCEGQQLDIVYEKRDDVKLQEYIRMIELKTSVLLAASMQMGSILGGASEGNQLLLYEFGKKLGISFQIQDDYLDAFGDPQKFGKQVGGDIMTNKKTFLMIRALECSSPGDKKSLHQLSDNNSPEKVAAVIDIFRRAGVDQWASQLKDRYVQEAFQHFEDIAVLSSRKEPLRQLAHFLVQRDH